MSVRKGKLWQLLAEDGSALTEMKWQSLVVDYYQPELSKIEANDAWGLLNAKTGEIVIAPRFESIFRPTRDLNPTFIAVDDTGIGRLFDATGKKLCELPELELERVEKQSKGWPLQFIDDLVVYPRKSGWGAIDVAGNTKIPFHYDFIGARGQRGSIVDDGLVQVTLGDKTGFVTTEGKAVSQPKWDTAGFFSEGLAYVSYGNRWAFINKSGKVAIGPFDMGQAAK